MIGPTVPGMATQSLFLDDDVFMDYNWAMSLNSNEWLP